MSVVALNGMTFDLATPHGRMMATMLAGIAEFERELIQERIRSGIAAAKARGMRLGRQPGQRPKSDRLASKVLALVDQGTQLSPDRARGGAEQEYRRRYRQTSPRQGDSDRLTATLHLVTRMLGQGQLGRATSAPARKAVFWHLSAITALIARNPIILLGFGRRRIL